REASCPRGAPQAACREPVRATLRPSRTRRPGPRGPQRARVAAGAALSLAAVSSSAPNTDLPRPAGASMRRIAVALPALAALAYCLGHLGWYLGTPLGRVPVLDERENMDLAEAIFGGTLPWAPFYRAPGYALALAGLRAAGVSAGALFPAALLLGAALHAF